MNKIRVMVVEDHHATLEGVSICLSRDPELDVIGICENSVDGLEMARSLAPDVIVLDLHLPGILTPKAMVQKFITTSTAKLIIFSAENRLAVVQATLSMGVAAYLLKTERVGTLASIVKRVHSGETGITSEQISRDSSKMTKAEEEILVMLAEGLRYQEIANLRLTAASTVRKQCDMLILKLGLDSREKLIAWAVSSGFGTLNEKRR